MVGMMMAANSRERLSSLVDSAKLASNIPSKLDYLRHLKQDLLQEDLALLSELLPRIFDLLSDRFSPIRKFATEMIGEIGLKQSELLPEVLPVLINILDDGTPAVARQAITCEINLFRRTLEKIAMQGLHSGEMVGFLESSWTWMLKFKEKIYSIAFQDGSGGIRLLALKFVEDVILLFTPDPNASSEPPPHEGDLVEFNISWFRAGHPVLNVGDLSVEASQSLGLLLDQLRFPTVNSLSQSTIVVLINSLSAIAKKRPAFYGRVLPVLLGLNPSSFVVNGIRVSGTHHALKKAFLTCLKCTHPGAAPWRGRIVGALKEMKAGGLAEHVLSEVNGSADDAQDDKLVDVELKPSFEPYDYIHANLGRKRLGTHRSSDTIKDEESPGKRVRSRPCVSEESTKGSDKNNTMTQEDSSSSGPTTSRSDVDNGPVQQLIAMFGALVAQGEKAFGSLEILISSISPDLLAEVVMANMRFLPPNHPKAEEDDEPLVNMSMVGDDSQVKYPPSFVADVLSLASTFTSITSLVDAHKSISNDAVKYGGKHGLDATESAVAYASMDTGAETASLSAGTSGSSDVSSTEMKKDSLSTPDEVHDVGNLDSEIPGLDSSTCHDGFSELQPASSLASTELEEANQEQVIIFGQKSPVDLLPSMSTERSEELSPKSTVAEVSSMVSSTATSVVLSSHLVLPKMSAPVVHLVDEEKDNLQKLAFARIVQAYKQIAVTGGSPVRSSLLACLGAEFPLDLDPWELIKKHILADYANHEGHELTLRVLYRLFGEAEEHHDFFSSTTATSVYETFLLAVVEALRDSLPPSDKSLSRLLAEVPYLPKPILKFLGSICSPGNGAKPENEVQCGDRVTQGLSSVWNLILLRPSFRNECLEIALQSAVHHLEEVRMKAIRLVANKLYPLTSISRRIEEFSKEMLHSVVSGETTEKLFAEGQITGLQKVSDSEKHMIVRPSLIGDSKDISFDTHQSCNSQSLSSLSISEAQRCMSLYFALCTKNHSLFREIFVIYNSASAAVKQAVEGHIPILVRTMGSSSDLLEIISDPPVGSESLLMQVLHTLTDGTIPSPQLIFTIRKLYDSKVKDVEIIIPVLPSLPKEEIKAIFPKLVTLPLDKFQAALARLLQGSSNCVPVLAPAEVLIVIHGIDPDRDGIPLKKVTDACNTCFEQRHIFTQQVIAQVLNQLVEQIPIPILFMRTVLQAIGAFPGLVDFVLEMLSRLVSKQIWKYPKLWVGFLKCAFLTKPQSFTVLLQLPAAQLENALSRTSALRAPLVAHASQLEIRSTLPRSILAVLGIASDSQASNHTQAGQPLAGEVSQSNSDKELVEESKESSGAR